MPVQTEVLLSGKGLFGKHYNNYNEGEFYFFDVYIGIKLKSKLIA